MYEGLPIRQIEIEIEIGIGIVPCPVWHLALMDRSNFTAELCQHRNSTVGLPGFSFPNPSPRPFDTDPAPDSLPNLRSSAESADPISEWDSPGLCPNLTRPRRTGSTQKRTRTQRSGTRSRTR